MKIDISKIKTPCYILAEGLLIRNLNILKSVSDATGCKILLAQKAFSMYSTYPLIRKYLSGTTASSLFEARLGYEEMGGEVHIFSPAYRPDNFEEISSIAGHIVFNSLTQWQRFKPYLSKRDIPVSCGIRINPEYSEIETDMYNPCFTHSRLGMTHSSFTAWLEENAEGLQDLSQLGIEGLHFHTMCEQDSDTLERTLAVVEDKFGKYLKHIKWLNMGGGHHITRDGYDIEKLKRCILSIKQKYGVEVYLEPGEAVALNSGFLVAEVLDIVHNGMEIAILDTSAACHMPDVLEMPYRPNVFKAQALDSDKLTLQELASSFAKPAGQGKYTYRLGTHTCLAGDVIGDYSFSEPLNVGDRLVFTDMAIYSMVKNNTFNGINLPSIMYLDEGGLKTIKSFDYEDFKSRL